MHGSSIALLLAAAIAWPSAIHAQGMSPAMADGSNAMGLQAAPVDKAMKQGMMKMRHDMAAAPTTGNPDHDFVAMMLPHHQGAVSMAEVELKYGHDPEMRTLARDIVGAQKREMAQMQAWQAAHPAAIRN